MRIQLLFIVALILIASVVFVGSGSDRPMASDQVPGPASDRPVVLTGGTIYPVAGEPIENGTLIFSDGKIVAMGTKIKMSEGAQVIDVTGKRIYPALIACGTQLGLVEIGAVRATRDQREVGDVNPNVRAEVSVNPDSEIIPVTRANGIGLAMSVPQGGLMSGSSALLRLDGWTWEELTFEAPTGVHVNWPGMRTEVPGDDDATKKRRKSRDENLAKLRAMFEAARAYGARRDGEEVDLRCEALLPVVERKIPAFFHAGNERDIRAAIAFAAEMKIRAVIVGGREAPRVAKELKAADVAVIYGPVHALPGGRDADYDEVFAGPARLHEAGVKFAIAGFETSSCRNLPYHAATAAAYGLPPEEALRSITLSPAEILGVGDRVGSLVEGHQATLIVTDGDPLEITTNVERMWIDGRAVDLGSRHTQLYEKYRERIEREVGPKRREF